MTTGDRMMMMTWKRWAATAAVVLAATLLAQACGEEGPSGPPASHTLTVLLDGIGQGTVTSEPAGIDCSVDGQGCSATFDEGTQVTLTAGPTEGMTFTGWSGDGTGAESRTVTMDANRSVTAAFDDPDKAVQQVGAEGGEVASRDGGMTLMIPAGALAAAQEITIERIDPAELGAEWAELRDAGEIEAAYDLGPDGLAFERPVTVSVAPKPVVKKGDTAMVALQPLATSTDGAVENLDSVRVEVDVGAGTSVARGEISHFSPMVVIEEADRLVSVLFTFVSPMEVRVGEEFTAIISTDADIETRTLEAVVLIAAGSAIEHMNTSTFHDLKAAEITFVCNAPGEYETLASMRIRERGVQKWLGGAEFYFLTTCVQPPQFELSVALSGDGDGRVRSADADGAPDGKIDCVKKGAVTTGVCAASIAEGDTVFLNAIPETGSEFVEWIGDLTGAESMKSLAVDGPKSINATFRTLPPPPAKPIFRDLHRKLLEAMMKFPLIAAATAADADEDGCPDLLIAGQGGAVAVNPCTGETIQDYDIFNNEAFFFDAIGLTKPEGTAGSDELLLTGQGSYSCVISDDGVMGLCAIETGEHFHLDAASIAEEDPSAGAIVVEQISDGSYIHIIRFDPEAGHFARMRVDGVYEGIWTEVHPEVPPNIRSAAAGAVPSEPFVPPAKLLAVANTNADNEPEGVLYVIDVVAGEAPVGTKVGMLEGNDPRRIRCDFTSGICAISDFTSSRVTIVRWDGVGAPVIVDVTEPGEIADGPVGLDVFGRRIVTAGFNDNRYSIIEVDEAGEIARVTTTPLPEGCVQPGHAIFLEDASNSVVASCWGSNGFAYVPEAF